MARSSTAATNVRALPTAAAEESRIVPLSAANQVAPIGQGSQVVPVARFAKIVPTKPTRREKQLGKEIVVRAMVMEGHLRLQHAAAVAITRMHDHTHEQICEGIVGMNTRVRSVADPDDQAELAGITAEQKAMFVRQQFGLLEAGAYRVAQEVDRELYSPARQGLVARLLGD